MKRKDGKARTHRPGQCRKFCYSQKQHSYSKNTFMPVGKAVGTANPGDKYLKYTSESKFSNEYRNLLVLGGQLRSYQRHKRAPASVSQPTRCS